MLDLGKHNFREKGQELPTGTGAQDGQSVNRHTSDQNHLQRGSRRCLVPQQLACGALCNCQGQACLFVPCRAGESPGMGRAGGFPCHSLSPRFGSLGLHTIGPNCLSFLLREPEFSWDTWNLHHLLKYGPAFVLIFSPKAPST